MTEWTLICRIEDIPVLGSRRVARPQGLDVAVFRNDAGGVFAPRGRLGIMLQVDGEPV